MTGPRTLITASLVVAGSAILAACGQGIDVAKNSPYRHGAQLFSERCSGCHTLDVVGAEGSATTKKYREKVDGPNFNQRKEQKDQILYAIRNGGFSGAIMPQNIAVGQDAQDLAAFLAKYSGKDAKRPKSPTPPSAAPVPGQ